MTPTARSRHFLSGAWVSITRTASPSWILTEHEVLKLRMPNFVSLRAVPRLFMSMHFYALIVSVFLLSIVMAGTASAQAGAPCSGTSCGLGGQIRGQIGDGLPLPISIAPAQGGSGAMAVAGPFTAITIQSAPATPSGLPLVGKGLGQPGQIKPTPAATIMQTTAPGTGPRALTLAPGAFRYTSQPQGSIGVMGFGVAAFVVETNLSFVAPHPGTTKLGAPALTQESGAAIPTAAANAFFAGGRVGAATVTYYADATGVGASAANNFGHGVPPVTLQTAMAGDSGAPPINGIARFSSTGNQFGGQAVGRTTGTARVFFNGVPLDPPADLPCKVTATPLEGTTGQGTFVPFVTGPNCQFSLSIVDFTGSDATVGVAGGGFNGLAVGSAFQTSAGVFTGTIGFNGTIIGQGDPVTVIGMNIPFTGQGNQAVGMPLTTGMLSITVTDVVGATSEMFIRTGTDARDAAGNGVVALVTGSMTARDISGGNANRTWITLEIPEPSAIFAASAGLFALFGMHRVARRRS